MIDFTEEFNKNYKIWGRTCDINIVFECYGKDMVSEEQKETFKDFEINSDRYFSDAKEALEKYLLENYAESIENNKVENIFKYIVPYQMVFKQYTEDKNSFGLICHFRFDTVNDIAVRFADGKIVKIGSAYII